MTEYDSWLLRQLWAYEDQQELAELANDSDSEQPSNLSNNEPNNL